MPIGASLAWDDDRCQVMTSRFYGRKKRGVAYNHQGQRVGRPYVAAWAEAEIVLAADLG